MPEERFPIQWAGQQALVTLPQHIDRGNAGQIGEQLLWIINRGAAVLIADLTGTLSCDYSGADALGRAHHRAVANGTELRLVVTAAVVRRVLTLTRPFSPTRSAGMTPPSGSPSRAASPPGWPESR